MKTLAFLKLLLLPLLVFCAPKTSSQLSPTTLGVFEGTSLCADFARPFLNIPAGAQCDRIKWKLTLYIDPRTGSSTTYKLNSEYGYHVDNRTLLMKGSSVREGNWMITRGAMSDPNARVYQLNSDDKQMTISFQAFDSDILHLLDRDNMLVIGNSGQSYTLSRTSELEPSSVAIDKNSDKSSGPRHSPTRSRVVSVFSGRTPCREVAQQLNRTVPADCMKLKWSLTLYQDPNRQIPTTYKLKGTLFRDLEREGKWVVIQGRGGDPGALIFKIQPDNRSGSILLLNQDDNILFFLNNDGSLMVGNRDFSYTLNRADDRMQSSPASQR